MRLSIHEGDICDAPADAACSSTNPHLELILGTGGALRTKGGWSIQVECKRLVDDEQARTGKRFVPVGSVHWTSAGTLPFAGLIHAVAIDPFHCSSTEIVRQCARGALEVAQAHGVERLAMPAFASGMGDVAFQDSLAAVVEACGQWRGELPKEVVLVIRETDHVVLARRLVGTTDSRRRP